LFSLSLSLSPSLDWRPIVVWKWRYLLFISFVASGEGKEEIFDSAANLLPEGHASPEVAGDGSLETEDP